MVRDFDCSNEATAFKAGEKGVREEGRVCAHGLDDPEGKCTVGLGELCKIFVPPEKKAIREFSTGATRDTEEGKYDYEGFLSPLVLERYAQYMHKHRHQSDGNLRESDNWQKGIPPTAYIKSAWRHFMDWWKEHRNDGGSRDGIEDALCGMMFNVMGYLHEHLKAKKRVYDKSSKLPRTLGGLGPR